MTENVINDDMSLVTRKPVFRPDRYKPVCVATEARWKLEISDMETRGIILSKQQTTKVLIRLRGCTGWSAPLLFAYGKNRFSHDAAHTKQPNYPSVHSKSLSWFHYLRTILYPNFDMIFSLITAGSTTPAPQSIGLLNCNFESTCSYTNVTGTDNFDWTKFAGSTASSGTGPLSDHTLGTRAGN